MPGIPELPIPDSLLASGESPQGAEVFAFWSDAARPVLDRLGEKDREILTRFFVQAQSQDQICAEMSLTETQFRLLKSRAKERFGQVGRRDLSQQQPQSGQTIAPWDGQGGEVAECAVDIRRILPVVAHAVAVFGDEKKASHWLTACLPILGDRSPSQLLKRHDGVDLIEQILTRIEHNIPS